MAVLEKMRARGGLLATIIGIALLSFVVGDFFGNRSGRYGGLFASDAVGSIGGEDISLTEYNERVDYFTAVYSAMGRSTQSEGLSEEIREQAWYALVQQYAIEPEYAHLGLAVSKDELFDLIAGKNPSPLALRYFSNPQTGAYDRAQVLQYLQDLDANPNVDAKTMWLYLEKEIGHQRVQEKLLALVGKSLYATSLEARQALENSVRNASVEYVMRAYSEVGDSAIKVSSGDIKSYYNKNKKRYEQSENCDIEYVVLAIEPSAEDDAAVRQWIEALAPQFAAAKDVRMFAAQNSDGGFDDKYYKKSDLEGRVAEFAFEKNSSDFLPPYEENGAYKMARVADVRVLPDSVRARHILLAARKTMDETRKVADSIKRALLRGASFAALSEQYSVDDAAKQKGGDLGWFAQKTMVKPFGDSCFFAPKNHVMVVETNYGVHVVQVTDKGAAERKAQVAVVAREVAPSKATRTELFALMNDIATQAGSSRQAFVDAAAERNMPLRTASRITINDRDVQQLRNARELVRWAWKADAGAVSPVFEIDDNFVIAALALHRKDGYAAVEQVRTEIASAVLQEKKGELLLEEVRGMDVAAAATKFDLTPKTADGINFASFYITGMGVEPKVAGAISAAAQGRDGMAAGSAGVYVYKVTAVSDGAATDDAVGEEKRRMQRMANQRAGYEVLNVLRSAAKIKDRRGEVIYY